MKSKELKQYNLPEDRIVLARIDAKPNGILCCLLFVGFSLVTAKILIWGGSLALLSIVGLVALPNRILIEFYSDYLVLFNHANKNVCEIIYYEDVVRWKYASGLGYDTLKIRLTDDSVHTIDGFSRMTFENLMNRFLKDKKASNKKTKK